MESTALVPENKALEGVNRPSGIDRAPINMVGLDTDGSSTGIAILVGGPAVNAMTAEVLAGSSFDFGVDSIMVKEMSNGTIVVAGKTAADTMAAAEQFIADIKRQK